MDKATIGLLIYCGLLLVLSAVGEAISRARRRRREVDAMCKRLESTYTRGAMCYQASGLSPPDRSLALHQLPGLVFRGTNIRFRIFSNGVS